MYENNVVIMDVYEILPIHVLINLCVDGNTAKHLRHFLTII